MSGIGNASAGGVGTVKYAYYKTDGQFKKWGLRNKRSAHQTRERQKKLRLQDHLDNLRQERENRYMEEAQQYGPRYNQDN